MLGSVDRGSDAPLTQGSEDANRHPQQSLHALHLGRDEWERIVSNEREGEERRQTGRHDQDAAHTERDGVGGGRPRLLR